MCKKRRKIKIKTYLPVCLGTTQHRYCSKLSSQTARAILQHVIVQDFCFFNKNDFIWNRNAFKHELEVLEKVRHPNVVQFVGAVTQNIPMMIVSEYHPKVNSPSLFIFNCFSNCIWGAPKKYCCLQTLYLCPFMHNFAVRNKTKSVL